MNSKMPLGNQNVINVNDNLVFFLVKLRLKNLHKKV